MLERIVQGAVWVFLLTLWAMPIIRLVMSATRALLGPFLSPIVKLATSGIIGFTIVAVSMMVVAVIIYRLFTKGIDTDTVFESASHVVVS